MNQELLEKVARAICTQDFAYSFNGEDKNTEAAREKYVDVNWIEFEDEAQASMNVIADYIERSYDHMSVGMNTSAGLIPSHAVRFILKSAAKQLREDK